jgi:hypothetical protein
MNSHAARTTAMKQRERPNMKTPRYFAVLAITLLPLLITRAQTSPIPSSPSGTADKLSPGATEVEKLAQSGVGNDVVLSDSAPPQKFLVRFSCGATSSF